MVSPAGVADVAGDGCPRPQLIAGDGAPCLGQDRVMLGHLRRSDDAIHGHRRADGQPIRWVKGDGLHAVQAFYVHQVLRAPKAVAHADESIGAAHKRAGLSSIAGQELAGFGQ